MIRARIEAPRTVGGADRGSFGRTLQSRGSILVW